MLFFFLPGIDIRSKIFFYLSCIYAILYYLLRRYFLFFLSIIVFYHDERTYSCLIC